MVNPSPQALYNSVWHAATTITSTEGLVRLWRGVASVFLGAGPAHALYFTVYEQMKKTMVNIGEEGHSPFSTGMCKARDDGHCQSC